MLECFQFWNGLLRRDAEKPERVHERATKMVRV